jgi:hypothetical protein
MSKAAIAKAEGVRESTIWESIERGLRNIEKFLKIFPDTPKFCPKNEMVIRGTSSALLDEP